MPIFNPGRDAVTPGIRVKAGGDTPPPAYQNRVLTREGKAVRSDGSVRRS